jgi:hypothetical protein
MEITTVHKVSQTVRVKRQDLRRLIRNGAWARLIENFKIMKVDGYKIAIHRV